MPTDNPLILGVFLVILAGISLVDIVRNRATIFDSRVSDEDRLKIIRFVLFVLLPLSVLAHEGGHALAVTAWGGEVIGFGFFLFYGYVEHRGFYTPNELALIAFAGPAVNIVLGLAAIAVAWFLPRRPAVNYLLFVFGIVQLLEALVFYPLLGAFGGIAGDWQTIYSLETPLLSGLIGLLHVGVLGGGAVLWRSARFQRGYAERTGRTRRVAHQPNQPGSGGEGMADEHPDQREMSGVLAVAAALASNGWRHPVHLITDSQAGGSQVIMRWESGGFQRALLVHATYSDDPEQHVELHAAVEPNASAMPPYQRELARIDGSPTTHELIPYLRSFLDFVDSWNGANVVSPN